MRSSTRSTPYATRPTTTPCARTCARWRRGSATPSRTRSPRDAPERPRSPAGGGVEVDRRALLERDGRRVAGVLVAGELRRALDPPSAERPRRHRLGGAERH